MQNRENEDGSVATWGYTPYPLAEVLEEHASMAQVVQLTEGEELSISVDDLSFKESGITASSNFFEVFSFPLVAGNPATVLAEQPSIVISETLSRKLFGDESALGKTIHINAGELIPFTVTGVFENVPYHSTLQFELVVPIENILPWNNYTSWGNSFLTTFVLLSKETDPQAISEQIAPVIKEKGGRNHELFLHSLQDTYLYTQFENGKPVGGRIDNIRLFAVVAILVLLIACINFVNLTTARATQRAKEVGVRKVVGASKLALIRQFLSESVFMAMVALILAIIWVAVVLPIFNQLTDKQITIAYFQPVFLLVIVCVGLLTGLLSGVYPAFFLSSFHTIRVLKGTVTRQTGSAALRRSLSVFQFALSTILMAGTLVVYFQMEYIRHKNLGLDQENIIYSEMDMNLQQNFEAYKNELLQDPNIQYFTRANSSFRDFGSTADLEWKGKPDDKTIWIQQLVVDFDFIEALDIKIKEGRAFSRDFASDTTAYIFNEEAVKVIGLEHPLGEEFSMWREPGQIVGIAENFHFNSLHETIAPLIIQLAPKRTHITYLKARAGKTQEALDALKRTHEKYSNYPLDYHFLDDTLEAMYKSEMLVSQLSRLFAGMAIFISCLGLLGLAIFTTEQRTKEIGIRKVLGASVASILMLLSKDYFMLILIAFLVAIPVANYFITEWLKNFAYRIEIQWWLFALPGVLVLLIALFSVSGQTWKAARKNPVDSLRYE